MNNCFEALVQERYADCDECLYDFSVADMAQKPQTAAGQRLRELLVDSYSYELSGDCEILGMDAKQTVSVTYLNLEKFALAVKERANSISEELNFLGTDVFTEEAALDIAVQAINDLEDEADGFRDTVQITVELRYDGTQWQVLYNADLENMIMGVGIKKQ